MSAYGIIGCLVLFYYVAEMFVELKKGTWKYNFIQTCAYMFVTWIAWPLALCVELFEVELSVKDKGEEDARE